MQKQDNKLQPWNNRANCYVDKRHEKESTVSRNKKGKTLLTTQCPVASENSPKHQNIQNAHVNKHQKETETKWPTKPTYKNQKPGKCHASSHKLAVLITNAIPANKFSPIIKPKNLIPKPSRVKYYKLIQTIRTPIHTNIAHFYAL